MYNLNILFTCLLIVVYCLDTWKDKDESMNKTQSFDPEMIVNAKRKEVEDEIRLKVDNLMRDELDVLRIAAERDKGKKGKMAKKRKKGKKKASKKGKKKKDKDLTPDRTPESLFEELVVNGIIKTFPQVPLKSFVGDMNFIGSVMKKRGGIGNNNGDQSKAKAVDPLPGGADIRRLITEYCILPMSSQFLRENAPHVKSLLLVGPEGAGKSMLLHAICTELGATLFDLTATNIVGKYPGKSGLNMLLHLVIKVSKQMQPSNIFIDQAEKTFLKKVSKTDKSDPKRLKKDLPRLVRSLTSEDRVILIGASRCPWECEQKGLTQTYQKMLVLPTRPDYGFRHGLWKELIGARGGRITRWTDNFDLSALTKVSDGYTAGHIAHAVNITLTERRVLQQVSKPLQPVEFIGALAKNEPVYREEEEAYSVWYSKTAMGKKRAKYIEGDDEDTKKEKKKSGAKKKKA